VVGPAMAPGGDLFGRWRYAVPPIRRTVTAPGTTSDEWARRQGHGAPVHGVPEGGKDQPDAHSALSTGEDELGRAGWRVARASFTDARWTVL
jgi:hypothetical protein